MFVLKLSGIQKLMIITVGENNIVVLKMHKIVMLQIAQLLKYCYLNRGFTIAHCTVM